MKAYTSQKTLFHKK